uniref:WRKY19-like zinc finger domain-containing protein n=1 Tax=Globisporangium ultimum (strain ATCC 200006 / CBS 805.95 / DAOM BR144) TaxID=431595 RepID=K3WJ60_GLOUD
MFRAAPLGVVMPLHHASNMHTFNYHDHQAPAQTQLHARLNIGPEDDDVFRQLWYEPEHDDHPLQLRMSGGSIVAHVNEDDQDDQDDDDKDVEVPPSSTNSLLLEPLELPPSSTASTGSLSLMQTLKDAFLNYSPKSPVASTSSLFESKAPSLSASVSKQASCFDPHSTSRSGFYDHEQPMMPVMPLRNQEYHQQGNGHAMANGASMNAVLGIHNAPWMLNTNEVMNSYHQQQRSMNLPSTATSMRQLLMSATAPSTLLANMENASATSPLWISTSMLMTPTSQFPAPELGRKISNKKSKARRPAKTPARGASALMVSLADKTAAQQHLMNSPIVTSRGNPNDYMPMTPESGSEKNSKGKKCVEPGCARRAQSNSRCKAHGGGARCQYTGPGGCTRSSQGGGYCRAHGGGKRCEYPGCLRGQQRKGRCYVHGGIRKCQMGDCEKKDRGNGFCISHGGGKRCEHPGCSRAVRRGLLCQLHEIAH